MSLFLIFAFLQPFIKNVLSVFVVSLYRAVAVCLPLSNCETLAFLKNFSMLKNVLGLAWNLIKGQENDSNGNYHCRSLKTHCYVVKHKQNKTKTTTTATATAKKD